jgi:hypothetical protein
MSQAAQEIHAVEAKFGGSGLSQGAAKGPQMSRAWIEKSLDQKIDSLKKAAFLNPDIAASAQANREITLFENAKKAVARGAYKRRIFHGAVSQGHLTLTLSGVAEAPVNGEVKTLLVKPVDGPTAKGGSRFWHDTPKGRQLKIPLARDAFDKMKAKASPSEARFLSAQRKRFLEAFGRTLTGHGVAPREAQRLVNAVMGGSIRSSGDLNRATALALGLPAPSGTAVVASRPPAKVAGQPSMRPFPGRADIAGAPAGRGLPGRTGVSFQGRRAFNQPGQPFPKPGPAFVNTAHYSAARKVLVPINVLDDACKLMETCLAIDMLYSGRMSHKSFFDHSGHILGSVGGKIAGAWAGAKAGAAVGAVFGPWGVISGMVAGSIVVTVCFSEFFGKKGEQASSAVYDIFKKPECEEYQRLYVKALNFRYGP